MSGVECYYFTFDSNFLANTSKILIIIINNTEYKYLLTLLNFSFSSRTPLPTVSWEQWYSSLTAAVQANQYTDPSSALALAPLFEFLNPGGLSSHRGMIHEASLAFYLALAADPALDTVTANRLALFTRDRLEPSWARQCAVFLRDVLEEERTDATTLKELMEAERVKDLSEL